MRWPAANREEGVPRDGSFSGSPEWAFTSVELFPGSPGKWLPFGGVLSGSARDRFTPGDGFPRSVAEPVTSDCVLAGSPSGRSALGDKFPGRPGDPLTEHKPLEVTILRTETTWTRFVPTTTKNRPLQPSIRHGN
ncbi:MAG TPA: hypothetical protein VGW57_16715 [Chthoniobacterales bacterium]|nr:hypothetical protein [Chthoniobacterales bacterium]